MKQEIDNNAMWAAFRQELALQGELQVVAAINNALNNLGFTIEETSTIVPIPLKQGEQEETLCDKCRKEQPSHSCQDITALGRCALEKQGEQNPAWSEEDEKMLNDAIGAVGIADYYTYDDKQEIENWLKSLKDRVQPKQEWSEEDKKLINDTCHLINTLASGYGEKVTEPISFTGVQQINSIKTRLRALVDSRPQNTWKPSDLQIKALEYYTKGGCVDKEGIFGSELVKLLEELKKL